MKKIPLIAVVGPTASGKTKLGVELAKSLDGEIVSADSMQIYKGIPLAAAVPTEEEKQGIPHHLIEVISPEASFSVADYVNLARKAINDIYRRKKQPILVGGTGLYVNSLIDGTEFVNTKTDYELRQRLQEQMDREGPQEMLKKLAVFDEKTAQSLHPNNRRRIIRAFEVYLTTGITFSKQNELSKINGSEYDSIIIGITFKDRKLLYGRIEKRIDLMLENGLLKEAEEALKLSDSSGAAQAIGHKEFSGYFKGEESLKAAVERLKTETRHYAKRQLTWFNRRQDINWIYADEEDPAQAASEIIRRRKQDG